MQTWPVLSTLIVLPTVGALIILGMHWIGRYRRRPVPDTVYPTIALFISGTVFLMTVPVLLFFNGAYSAFQFAEEWTWIPDWRWSYRVGLDGLSVLLFGLTALLTPLAVLSAWKEIRAHVPGFYSLLLFLETTLLGVFAATDLAVFYVFWELMLIPMFFIIFLWGGPRRVYAAFKFLLFTFFGSLFMLAGILYLYVKTGTLAFAELQTQLSGQTPLTFTEEIVLFLAFAIAFAIKVPLVPFHTWLPAAHVEAPTPGSVILAGVLLKMGTYGLIRFCIPWFPHAALTFQWPMVVLGVIGIVYGAWAALAQTDMKRLVAYSSISHLGLIVVGLFALRPMAVQGAILQMVNHGLTTGALFMLVGVLYIRRHTREMASYGGIATVMPRYAAVFLVVMLASIGLPLLNGFVGEFLILWGAFQRYPKTTVVAVTGVIWSAVYMLRMYRRVMHGPVDREENRTLSDLDGLEWAGMVPIVLLCIWIGVWATPFLTRTEAATRRIAEVYTRVESQISGSDASHAVLRNQTGANQIRTTVPLPPAAVNRAEPSVANVRHGWPSPTGSDRWVRPIVPPHACIPTPDEA